MNKSKISLSNLAMNGKDALFLENAQFILENKNILSSDIPQRYLNYWVADNENSKNKDEDTSLQLLIFVLVGKQVQKTGDNHIQLNCDRILNLYEKWLTLFTLESLARKGIFGIKLVPCKILDFDNYDTIDSSISVPNTALEKIKDIDLEQFKRI